MKNKYIGLLSCLAFFPLCSWGATASGAEDNGDWDLINVVVRQESAKCKNVAPGMYLGAAQQNDFCTCYAEDYLPSAMLLPAESHAELSSAAVEKCMRSEYLDTLFKVTYGADVRQKMAIGDNDYSKIIQCFGAVVKDKKLETVPKDFSVFRRQCFATAAQ